MSFGVKVAFVTGAARGIGEEVARELARRGFQVALVGLEFDRMQMIAAEINAARGADGDAEIARWAIALEADVTDSFQLESAVDAAVKAFGRIDVVVANAGIANHGSFASTHVEDLARVVNVNLIGVIRTIKATHEALLDSRGYALLISSASAFPALPGVSVYGASKAGVDQFANNLRVELRPAGVDVGVAYPSWIETDLVRDLRDELPHFRRAMAAEPRFFGRVTPLEECVAILMEGIEARRRWIYIPDSIGVMHWLRTLMVTGLWDAAIGFVSKNFLADADNDRRAVGKSFGRSSVEAKRQAGGVELQSNSGLEALRSSGAGTKTDASKHSSKRPRP